MPLNRRQTSIAMLGAAAVVLTLVYPPWVIQGGICWDSMGYGLFYKPPHRVIRAADLQDKQDANKFEFEYLPFLRTGELSRLNNGDYILKANALDLTQLLPFWFVIVSISLLLLIATRNPSQRRG